MTGNGANEPELTRITGLPAAKANVGGNVPIDEYNTDGQNGGQNQFTIFIPDPPPGDPHPNSRLQHRNRA